jgi:hypothetical protein
MNCTILFEASQREIADEAIRRGLVSNISQRSLGRFLKKPGPLWPEPEHQQHNSGYGRMHHQRNVDR